MRQLLVCREFPPAPYPAGGIGTYARHIAGLLAAAGETVHVIAQRWEGAPERISGSCDGNLIVHRIALDEPLYSTDPEVDRGVLRSLASSTCPSQLFSWQVARYAERLIETESIDLIEAQEWEAPLYYLQVRRALGLGPARQPPILVHLHSPSAMIFRYNEWDTTLTDFEPLCRMEEYSIRAADALVCPSRYLAKGVTDLFRLPPDRVNVLPYPMGETQAIDRGAEVWSRDAICYVGRLELRKGVVEWVDAAARVAATHPTVTFDFFGSDTSLRGGVGASVLDELKSRIPRALLRRFFFHGSRSQAELLRCLSQVAVAVVPSRWENFPFTCIEAMATGLPVLVSPHGGMAELVSEGESGWVAPDGTPASLELALLRVLATPHEERRRLGAGAAAAVRRICANDMVVQLHLDLRQRLAREGAARSLQVAGPEQPQCLSGADRRSMGVVVTCTSNLKRLPDCVKSILQQQAPVYAIVVIEQRLKPHLDAWAEAVTSARPATLSFIFTAESTLPAMQRQGAEALLAERPYLRSIVWIDQDFQLDRDYVDACDSVFNRQPAVGAVFCWRWHASPEKDLDPGPTPVSFETTAETVLLQGTALQVNVVLAAWKASGPDKPLSWSALANGGWKAVTYPGSLVTILPAGANGARHTRPERRYSGMALIQSGSVKLTLQWFLAAPLREQWKWLRRIAGDPQRVASWAAWHLRQKRSPDEGSPNEQ